VEESRIEKNEKNEKKVGEQLFCLGGVGLGLGLPLGQFPPNVAVGLLASDTICP